MAHGEAERGCAEGEQQRRPGEPEYRGANPPAAGPHRGVCGCGGQPTEDPPPAQPPYDRQAGCRSNRDGWAGAHRHGAVRPRPRTARRERPPRRWC